MTDRVTRVTGDLVVTPPGARSLRVRLEGSPRRIVVDAPSVSALVAASSGLPIATIARRLAKMGVTVSVGTPRVRLAQLGDPSRPMKLHPLGAIVALFTVPLPRLARAGRRWRDRRGTP